MNATFLPTRNKHVSILRKNPFRSTRLYSPPSIKFFQRLKRVSTKKKKMVFLWWWRQWRKARACSEKWRRVGQWFWYDLSERKGKFWLVVYAPWFALERYGLTCFRFSTFERRWKYEPMMHVCRSLNDTSAKVLQRWLILFHRLFFANVSGTKSDKDLRFVASERGGF